MREKPLILVADDEEDMREMVCMKLHQAGFDTLQTGDGNEACVLAVEHIPDAVVLDVMMPGRDGFRVCEMLRSEDVTKHMGIVMLTAKGDARDRIYGLQKGADDYMSKPFSPSELVLRLQALLRRARPAVAPVRLKVGPFFFDLTSVEMSVRGEVVPLTLLEFKLLHTLASRHGGVVDRDAILREVWGYGEHSRSRTLDTHVKRLREKLGPEGAWLHTVRGVGYMLAQPQPPAAMSDIQKNGLPPVSGG